MKESKKGLYQDLATAKTHLSSRGETREGTKSGALLSYNVKDVLVQGLAINLFEG